MSISSTKSITF